MKDQKVPIYRTKEVVMPAEGPTLPLRDARIAVRQQRLEENIEGGHLDEAEPTSDVEDRSVITTANAIEDGAANGRQVVIEDGAVIELANVERDGVTSDDDNEEDPEGEHEAPAEGLSQALVRIPRAKRICIPWVCPPPREPAVHLDLDMRLEFDQTNPKRAETMTHALYEQSVQGREDRWGSAWTRRDQGSHQVRVEAGYREAR